MDTSGSPPPAPANAQPTAPVVPHPNLIRTDQVQKLPHLDQKQKLEHANVIQRLWDIVNSQDAQSPEYHNALVRLTQISHTLMRGMRMFQRNRQQQIVAAQAQAAAAAAAATQQQPAGPGGQQPRQQQPPGQQQPGGGQPQRGPANPQSFAQLLPHIQQKINGSPLFPPINLSPEQVPQWLAEAKLRYGIALQKHEIGRAKSNEFQQQLNQRQVAQNLSREEAQELKNRQLAAEKIMREGTEFVTRFREQQEVVRAQRATAAAAAAQRQQQQQQQTGLATSQLPPASAAGAPSSVNSSSQQAAPVPAPHTVNSAVNAARNQANHQPATQLQRPMPTAHPQPSSSMAAAQQPKSETPIPAPGTPTATSQPQVQQPRLLSQQAAMQAAQSVNDATQQQHPQQQQQQQQQQNMINQQPQGYMPNRNPENSTRNTHMPIPRNLNVSAPEPVPMAPARPTLSGGPSHGGVGMMGQPAIQKHPGYVLEGEGQRVLSKKMLDILVRQVTGGGAGEGLTPDAEEVRMLYHKPPYNPKTIQLIVI